MFHFSVGAIEAIAVKFGSYALTGSIFIYHIGVDIRKTTSVNILANFLCNRDVISINNYNIPSLDYYLALKSMASLFKYDTSGKYNHIANNFVLEL